MKLQLSQNKTLHIWEDSKPNEAYWVTSGRTLDFDEYDSKQFNTDESFACWDLEWALRHYNQIANIELGWGLTKQLKHKVLDCLVDEKKYLGWLIRLKVWEMLFEQIGHYKKFYKYQGGKFTDVSDSMMPWDWDDEIMTKDKGLKDCRIFMVDDFMQSIPDWATSAQTTHELGRFAQLRKGKILRTKDGIALMKKRMMRDLSTGELSDFD